MVCSTKRNASYMYDYFYQIETDFPEWAAPSFGTYHLSPLRAAKASLWTLAVLPEPSLLAHRSSVSRGTFKQEKRSLTALNSWVWTFKVGQNGMLWRESLFTTCGCGGSGCFIGFPVLISENDICCPFHVSKTSQLFCLVSSFQKDGKSIPNQRRTNMGGGGGCSLLPPPPPPRVHTPLIRIKGVRTGRSRELPPPPPIICGGRAK